MASSEANRSEVAASSVLRLGTRGSLLARSQSQLVANMLAQMHAGLSVELVVISTSGDQIAHRPLHEVGGKGLFVKELEQALLAGQIDLAVHSLKDMPVTMPLVEQADLVIGAVPAREDPRDVMVSLEARSIDQLKKGARVGTGSLRRRCQLLDHRPDLEIVPIRGNIDTRIRKLREGQFDAVILAAAGLARGGLFDPAIMTPLEIETCVPAAGQGALAIQCRASDDRTRGLIEPLNDASTFDCVAAERALIRLLRGDCLSPIGALATIQGDDITLKAAVGARAGEPPVLRAMAAGGDPDGVAHECFHILAQQHVEALLHG
ncbi:MAG TPA: hydroxymethylbilane synthase [Tepidisphaeraceae bacterium]|nr:hydroxymethylbilane synthase [Tepidisphaeraceae bacterium]